MNTIIETMNHREKSFLIVIMILVGLMALIPIIAVGIMVCY
jgi:hypothetical protein